MIESVNKYRKSFEELDRAASKFWPAEISEQEAELSVIPVLLQTQDQFISIIRVDINDLEDLFKIVAVSALPTNLFVKHLMILADVSGEKLKRISTEFSHLFPDGQLHYLWKSVQRSYKFRVVPSKKFSNQTLKVDGKHLIKKTSLSDLQKDAIALILFGSAYSGEDKEIANTLAKCEIGNYLGRPPELETFVKQRYIWVSEITKGAQANTLGQIAQQFVTDYLVTNLSLPNIEVKTSGHLPNVTHTDPETGRLTSFDIVVTDGTKYLAIEVSFQVTTNSVIERKAGQAKARYEQVEQAGHMIAYVLDGAGNFERETAVRVICSYSHCTVAFSRNELDVLCQFTREYFGKA